MGDLSAHKRKAHHNEKFLDVVQRNDPGPRFVFPDWMVNVAFYIALQYVDGKLASLKPPLHPKTHYDRNNDVANNLPRLAGTYFFLYGKSQFARYIPDSEKRISASMVNRCVNLALTKFV